MPPTSHSLVAAAALVLLEEHQERTVTVKATQARHDFFPLLESVVADASKVVEVEHKGLQGRALLVNARFRDYVRQLEDTVRALLGPAPGAPTFRLAGSLSVVGDVEEGIETLRSQERRVAADRFTDL